MKMKAWLKFWNSDWETPVSHIFIQSRFHIYNCSKIGYSKIIYSMSSTVHVENWALLIWVSMKEHYQTWHTSEAATYKQQLGIEFIETH